MASIFTSSSLHHLQWRPETHSSSTGVTPVLQSLSAQNPSIIVLQYCAYEGNGEDVQTFAAGDSSPPAAANSGGATEEFSHSKSQVVVSRLPLSSQKIEDITNRETS
ncbi:hypothetical protein HanHA300_Chr08g0262141 [Helianthus annuus]|nr:hypothetical protein HanHA300_Chr08g0262141 [Helianthus annuus]KAJ0717598.1 hypothetical protein HanLR1_Chr08g0261021 [Helianthus annuus]